MTTFAQQSKQVCEVNRSDWQKKIGNMNGMQQKRFNLCGEVTKCAENLILQGNLTCHRTNCRHAAIQVQRVYRGHYQRKVYKRMTIEREKKERRQHFANCATLIQKIWRGYQVRRTTDFHKRKKYLAEIQYKGRTLKENLQRVQEEEAARVNEEKLQKMAEEWTTKVGKIHYLVSTKANPGVFSSKRDKMSTIVIRDKLLEDHIRYQGVSQAKVGAKYFNYKQARGYEEETVKLPPISVNRTNTQLLRSQMQKIQGKA